MGKNTLAGRREIVGQHSSSTCASTQFTNVLELHFKIEFDQHFVQRSTVTIDFKIEDIKLEGSEAYLLKLEKNLS